MGPGDTGTGDWQSAASADGLRPGPAGHGRDVGLHSENHEKLHPAPRL